MKPRSLSVLIAGGLVLLAARPGRAQEEWSFEGRELLVTNLLGKVTVKGHDGSRILVRAHPGGRDSDAIDFEVKHGGQAEFHVVFPLAESRRYVYPRLRGTRTRFSVGGWRKESSLLEEIFSTLSGRDRIEVTGTSRRGALEAWVDLEILVPAGVPTRVRLGVGELEARDIDGDIDLDSHSGSVLAENIDGDTRIDTGSGSVTAHSIRGALDIDTGSGGVEVSDVEGDVVRVDTGSGSVTVRQATSRRLEIDTGSGSVRTSEIDAGSTDIDTGSGSVAFSVERLGDGTHVIDTGSGAVTVTLPADASVHIHAETGSGGISLDVPAAKLQRMSRDEVDLEIGDGRADLQIDTGSGGITIRTRGNA